MLREIVETLVGVLSQHQSREQARRFFCLRRFLVALASLCLAVLLKTLDLANWLEIHLAISAIQKRKLTRQTFAEKITRDLARLVDLRQGQSRQGQTGWRAHGRNFRFDIVPTAQQIASEFFIGPRALHLIEHELVVLFD